MAQAIKLPEPTTETQKSENQIKQPRLIKTSKGLKMKRRFTQKGAKAYDMVEFEKRTSRITEPDGTVVFEMKDIEIPKTWSQLATDIIAQK